MAHRQRQHAADSGDGDHQRKYRKEREEASGHLVERERFAARLVQCFDPGNRDIRIDIANRPADSLYCCGRVAGGANEDGPYMFRMLCDRGVYLVRSIAVKAELLNVADHSYDCRGFGAAPTRDDIANRILCSPMPPCERQTHDSHELATFIIRAVKNSSNQNRYAKGLEVLRSDYPHRGSDAWRSSAGVKLLDPGSVVDGVRIKGKTGRHGG